MKVSENFNAGATKKPSATAALAAAIQNNFTAEEKSSVPVQTAVQEVPKLVVNEPVVVEEKSQQTTVVKEKKENFLVSMSQGERSNYKSLCALQNVSMNHFVICAMDYFKEELENGKVSISKHGYKRV